MSEVTVLGLCSDNLISIIQPSATVECTFGTGNGCCDTCIQPTQASFIVTGTGFMSPQSIPLQLNTSAPAIVTGSIQLNVTTPVTNTTIQVAIPAANWYSTLFVPAGTNGTVSIPFSVTTLLTSVTPTVTVQSGTITITGYTVPYTVLSL